MERKSFKMHEGTKIALVTGGSSGIGRAVCESLAERNVRVYEFSRRAVACGRAIHYSVDVTDEARVNEAVADILKKEGRIDILVNCAGFGISGAVEFTHTEDAVRQFDVNFFGMARVSKAVIPAMRKERSGRIVNISSVAAPVAIPFQAYYSASKAAVNSYTAALANELKPYGVSVCAVMPGDISTGFTGARQKNTEGDDCYQGRISAGIARMEKDEREGMSPSRCGRYIAKIALKKKVKLYCSVGFVYKFLCVLVKILPASLANAVVYRLYAK